MFTGIVEELGTIKALTKDTLSVTAKAVLAGTNIGDSIAINGTCLTVKKITKNILEFNVMKETLASTNLGELSAGDPVNLERAATLATRLGGHLVSGHIDAVGKVKKAGTALEIEFEPSFTKYVIKKGSIAINGVSLTIQKKTKNTVTIGIIPHTLDNTNLQTLKPQDSVNLEFDMIGKYVENIMNEKKGQGINKYMLG
jgi:riboflavin synthase